MNGLALAYTAASTACQPSRPIEEAMTKVHPSSWHAAKDVVFEALARPPADREAHVRQRCSDPEVCAAALAVLKDCATADDLATRSRLHIEPDELDDLDPGTRVGPYIIVDRIGRGGMGQVFLGRDPRLHRKVALKCLIGSSTSRADLRSRILHEARAAARISHPHVATVHDVIEHKARAFIVMEYVEGESLAARLRRGRLSTAEVIAMGRQLASALAAAHAEGIVHRDLKPANIQVMQSGSVKVLDFGIANATRLLPTEAARAATGNEAAQTAGLAQPGTPPYMSPEQLLGRPVDQRSDIYSLGVVLFEMVAGARPYTGSAPTALVIAQANGLPRADAVDPRVPRALADLIAKALESDAAQRFQSAADLATALDAIAARSSQAPAGARHRFTRSVVRFAAAAVVGIVALGAVGVLSTRGFNVTFGRVGPYARFGAEPWTSVFSWGVLAIFPSLLLMTFTAVIVIGVRFIIRVLELIGPIGRLAARIRARGRQAALTLGLDQPGMLAQALTGLGVLGIAGLCMHHRDLFNAWTSKFESAPIEWLLPMGPHSFARLSYQIEAAVLLLPFTVGLLRVVQLRRQLRIDDDKASVAMLAGTVAVMVLLIAFPYRILNWRDFERVDLAGNVCYLNGQTADELLILCPNSNPPRNRVVKRDDPTLHRLGIIENVFNGIRPTESPSKGH
jgi:hypothetical protein